MLALHLLQRIKATVPGSAFQLELDALEPDEPAQQQALDGQPPQQQMDNSRKLFWTPLGFLGQLGTSRQADVWSTSLWQTFFCTTLGAPVPILSLDFPKAYPCASFNIDAYGDHVHTCNKIAGITTAHNWAVGALASLFSSLGHSVRSQVKVTASTGQRQGDIEMIDYLDLSRDFTNLMLDLSFVHELHGASRANPQANGKLIFNDFKLLDQPLEDRARIKIYKYTQDTQDYANNTRSIFTPAVASTSGRIQAEFILLLFLHAHREAEEHVKHVLGMTGVAAQPNISDDYFKSKRAAFLTALKCKTGPILAKAASMRINANLEPAYLGPASVQRLSARRQMSLYTGALDHELRRPHCGA
jgi:hypothetical protein